MKGALAAPTQMTNKTVPNIPVHCTHRFAGVTYQQFKHLFQSRHEKKPKSVKGLDGVFSLKRLTENFC